MRGVSIPQKLWIMLKVSSDMIDLVIDLVKGSILKYDVEVQDTECHPSYPPVIDIDPGACARTCVRARTCARAHKGARAPGSMSMTRGYDG